MIVGCCGWRISQNYRERRRQRKTERSQEADDKTAHEVNKTGYEVDKTGHKEEEKLSDMSSSVKDDDSITVPPPTYTEALEDFKGEKSKEKPPLKE